jgi:RNA polymerase sigma factor (sigma-70 family)
MVRDGLVQAFLETREALARYLGLRGASADEAEDLLQEIYLKLSSDRSGPVAEPRAYLYRMTSNHFLDHRRTAGRRARREEDWVDVHSGEDRAIDETPSVEASLVAREQLAILQAVIDRLPDRTRLIFQRFRVDDEPQRRIAEDLGISVSAIEKHLTRAYEAIAAAKLKLDGEVRGDRRLSHERGRHGG